MTATKGDGSGISGCVRVHQSPELAGLAELWGAVATGQSCFQRFSFARTWGQVFFRHGVTPLVVHDAEGKWILPWAARDGVLFPLGHGVFDYVDVIGTGAAAGSLEARAGALARALRRCPDWRRMEMRGLPEDSPFLGFWRRLAAELGAEAAITPFAAAPLLRRGGGDAATVEAFARKHGRAEERLRQAQRRGWLGRVEPAAERRELLTWLLEQKQRRMEARGETNVLQAAEAEWLGAMAGLGREAGVELWAYRRDGRSAAGLVTFLLPPVRYGYLLAFAAEMASASPGITLLYFVLRATIGEGMDFDFLTGEQPFKLRFANAARRLLQFRLRRAPLRR